MAAPVNANNITVTRLCYPSGKGSEEMKAVAPTGEMTTLLVPPYVHNCSVVVEMLQGDRVLAVGRTSFESENYTCVCVLYPVTCMHLLYCVLV